MSMFKLIFSCWDCPLQEVPYCSLYSTVLKRFVDIISMFFMLNSCLVLLIMMLGNLVVVLSLPLAMFLVVLLLELHMTR